MMKTSELTIGDWACAAMQVLDGKERLTPPMRVVGIGETWVWLEIDPEQGDPFDEKIEDIRPIPLTVDILLKNGWDWVHPKKLRIEYRDEDEHLDWSVDVSIAATGRLYVETWILGYSLRMPVDYIHDLQHVLRLSKIDKEIEL